MADNITTSYMGLILPIPGITTGTKYAQDNNEAFERIDSHSHIPGQGLPIPVLGLNIDNDLTFNSFNAIDLRSSRYINWSSPLAELNDQNAVYVAEGNLFFNDAFGNTIQMTVEGAVNTSGSGNISGMGSTTASVVYTSIDKTFSFYSNNLTPAYLSVGPIKIGRNIVSPNQVTLITSPTISAPYTKTFADALPSITSVLVSDNAGQESYAAPDNRTMTLAGGILEALLPSGMIVAYGGTTNPSGWIICDGTELSRTTYSALFAAIADAYGAGNGTTTFNIPDLRGRFLRGVSGVSGNDPDAAGRGVSGAGGNSGNNVGSLQASGFASHTHTQDSHNHTQNSHVHDIQPHNHFTFSSTSPVAPLNTGNYPSTEVRDGIPVVGYVEGINSVADIGLTSASAGALFTDPQTATNVATTATNQNTGGNETRPVNIYANFIIKV